MLLIFLYIFTHYTYADTAQYTFKSINSDHCLETSKDQYAIGAQIPAGPFKGECLNLESQRNFKYLAQDQRYIKISNFFHDNKYWVARIPVGEVFKRVILQIEFFPPEVLAAHTQVRFDLKPGKYLRLDSQEGKEVKILSSFIISFEAVKVDSSPRFSLIKGLKNHFAMTARMFSLQESYKKIVLKQKHKNKQVVLDYNSKEQEDLFLYFLNRGSDNYQYKEMYNTFDNNCTTEVYEGFEAIRKRPTKTHYIGPKKTIKKERNVVHILEFLPSTAVKHTKILNIFKGFAPPLEDEFDSIENIFSY